MFPVVVVLPVVGQDVNGADLLGSKKLCAEWAVPQEVALGRLRRLLVVAFIKHFAPN